MRRNKIRYGNSIYWIAAFTGCFIFAGCMLLGVLFASKNYNLAKMEMEGAYKESFYELSDSVNGIEDNISKLLISFSDEQTVEIAEEIRIQSQMAQSSLNQLPLSLETSHDLNRFLNQVGDFCASYCHVILTNGEASVYEDRLVDIYEATEAVRNELERIASDFSDGKRSIISSIEKRGIKSAGNFILSYDSLADNIIEYPTLVYDGPYSDIEGEKCYKALDHLEYLSSSEAVEKARLIFLDMELENVRYLGTTSHPDSYDFSGNIKGGNINFSLSQRGGKLLYATVDYNANTTLEHAKNAIAAEGEADGIGYERALELAKFYAERCEYCNDLVPVWYNSIEGIAYVSLAPKINDVICYSDMVKVKLSLNDGSLIGIEAMGFCANNCVRTLSPKIDAKMAKSLASPKLEINNCRLTLIPLKGALSRGCCESEKLCYELTASYKNLNYFVYIDAITGKQVNIIRMEKNSEGRAVV